MLNKSELSKIEDFLKKTKDNVEIQIYHSDKFHMRFWECTPIQNMRSDEIKIKITLQKGKKSVNREINRLDMNLIKETISELKETLKNVDDNPYVMPMQKNNFPMKKIKAKVNPESVANNIKEMCRIAKNKKVKLTGTGEQSVSTFYLLNSKGLFAGQMKFNDSYSITSDFNGNKGGEEIISVNPIEKEKIKKITLKAIETSKLNANTHKNIKTGTYKAILSPLAFNQLLSMFFWYGPNAYAYIEKRSPAVKYLGKPIASEKIDIIEDPFYNEIYYSSLFDLEGNKRKKVVIVENGIFKNLLTDRYTAKHLKKPLTGHHYQIGFTGPSAVVVSNGNISEDDLIKKSDNVLYIKELHYINVLDPMEMVLTGMTRNGFFMIKKGKIAYPMNNVRFTMSLFDFMKGIEELTSDTHISEFAKTPGVLSNNFHISSTSTF